MSDISKQLAKSKHLNPTSTGPVWQGPTEDGVTFSLLSRFLCCRERFRLLVVEGLKPVRRFDNRTGYGDMWHVCEQAVAEGYAPGVSWEQRLQDHVKGQLDLYPAQQEEVMRWFQVCRIQFPIYVDYWSKHPEMVSRKPLYSEQVFDVKYSLPSGRKVRLRGKWDSVDLSAIGAHNGIVLMENKTKGDVDEERIVRQLTFDLQTMLYLVALKLHRKKRMNSEPIVGVRYNVVRRPLSGGKGTIVQKQATQGSKCPKCKGMGILPVVGQGQVRLPTSPQSRCTAKGCFGGRVGAKPAETAEAYFGRLAEYIRQEPETYFFRWNVRITSADIERFERECLRSVLEQLCDWWDWVSAGLNVWDDSLHYRFPYGVHNPTLEGGTSDLDYCIESGSEVGLRRVTNLFPELEET